MNIIRAHAFPLLALAALAFLIAAPLYAFPFYAGDEYRGINIAHFGNDEHHYLTRGKEVLEGNGLGQMYLSEGKELPDSFQSNIEQILLWPLVATGLGDSIDVPTLYNAANAVGVFFVLVLIYVLGYVLSRDRLLAVTCALFAVGGYSLVYNKTLFYADFNIYARSVFPYVAVIPFYGFLILTYKALTSNIRPFSFDVVRPYVYVGAAGALFGFLFYDYFYAWTFALAVLGSLGLASVLWRTWDRFYTVSLIAFIGLIIGSFKIASYYNVFTSELGSQFAYFFLTEHTRTFVMSLTGLATSLLFAVYFYFKRGDTNLPFIFALILAGWIALEQQFVTGRSVQYGHYYWYFVVPLSIIVSVYMTTRLIPERLSTWTRWFCFGLIGIVFLNTAVGQYQSFSTTLPGKMREQDLAPLIQKLKEFPRAVVLNDPSGGSEPFLVTIYTDHDLYWIHAVATSAFDIEHLDEAFLVYLYLNKEARRDPATYLRSALAAPTPNAYTHMYETLEGFHSDISRRKYEKAPFPRTDAEILALRGTFIEQVAGEYKKVASSRVIRGILEKDNVRYVLWDKRISPEWDLSALAPITLIATSSDAALYEIIFD